MSVESDILLFLLLFGMGCCIPYLRVLREKMFKNP